MTSPTGNGIFSAKLALIPARGGGKTVNFNDDTRNAPNRGEKP